MSLLQSIASTAASKAGAALVGTAFAVASVGAASATGILPQLTAADGDEIPDDDPVEPTDPETTDEDTGGDDGTSDADDIGDADEDDSTTDDDGTGDTDADDPAAEEAEGDQGETDGSPQNEGLEDLVVEPIAEDGDDSENASSNPVSELVGLAPGDPGFGQAVAERAREGGLGQDVSEIARNKHRGDDAEEGDGEEAGGLEDETTSELDAPAEVEPESTPRKGGKPEHARGKGTKGH